MIDGFNPYPAYRSSGVPWLGKVPEHWEVPHLRWLVRCLDGARVPLNAVQRGSMQGEYPYWGANRVIDHVNAWLFDEPLVLLGEDGAPFFEKGRDVAFFVEGKVWVNNHAHVLRCGPRLNPRFLAHALNGVDYTAFIDGSTRDKLTQQDMGGIPVQAPPMSEQAAIVRFLDYAGRRIRRYIRAKRKLIELLNEQKQAIIHRAVTRGLDPNVPLKPSGVQWLGEVPQHWGARRAKFCYREVDDRSTTGSEELLSVSHITGVTPRSQKNITMFLAESNVGYKVCRPGDLVINTMWAWMAALGVSRQHGIVSPSYAVYRPLRPAELLGEYVDLLLRTWPYRAEYWCRSTGIRASRFRLYPDQFLRIPLLCPPVSEQEAIVGFAAAKTANLRDAIESAQKEIALLREHRTRLISDVVTGKLDVREAAADLPDEDGVEDLADVEDAEPPEPMEGAAEAEDTIAADE